MKPTVNTAVDGDTDADEAEETRDLARAERDVDVDEDVDVDVDVDVNMVETTNELAMTTDQPNTVYTTRTPPPMKQKNAPIHTAPTLFGETRVMKHYPMTTGQRCRRRDKDHQHVPMDNHQLWN